MPFAMRMTFVDVIQDGSLRHLYAGGQKTGFAFQARLAYYRGHFLSAIDEFWVTVDGVRYDPAQCTFGINGKDLNGAMLNRYASEFWRLLEPAEIRVTLPGGLPEGEHEIDLHLMLRVPYLPLPGSSEAHAYMPIDSCGHKTLTIHD